MQNRGDSARALSFSLTHSLTLSLSLSLSHSPPLSLSLDRARTPPRRSSGPRARLRCPSSLETTQGQMDGFFGQLPYKCYLEEVASVGD